MWCVAQAGGWVSHHLSQHWEEEGGGCHIGHDLCDPGHYDADTESNDRAGQFVERQQTTAYPHTQTRLLTGNQHEHFKNRTSNVRP